jgi:hypothetical protein
MIDPKRLTEADLQREVFQLNGTKCKIQDWKPQFGTIRVKIANGPSYWAIAEDLDFASGTYQDGGPE